MTTDQETDERRVEEVRDTDVVFAALIGHVFSDIALSPVETVALAVATRSSSKSPPLFNARPNIQRPGSNASREW